MKFSQRYFSPEMLAEIVKLSHSDKLPTPLYQAMQLTGGCSLIKPLAFQTRSKSSADD